MNSMDIDVSKTYNLLDFTEAFGVSKETLKKWAKKRKIIANVDLKYNWTISGAWLKYHLEHGEVLRDMEKIGTVSMDEVNSKTFDEVNKKGAKEVSGTNCVIIPKDLYEIFIKSNKDLCSELVTKRDISRSFSSDMKEFLKKENEKEAMAAIDHTLLQHMLGKK